MKENRLFQLGILFYLISAISYIIGLLPDNSDIYYYVTYFMQLFAAILIIYSTYRATRKE